MSTIVPKPWGREVIFTNPGLPYTGKVLYLNAGSRLSLQSHEQKVETLALLQGVATITIGDQQTEMVPLEGYQVNAKIIHRVEAKTDTILLEASTPEIGDTTRIQDDYHRTNETKTVRNSPNRGWQPNQ